MTRSPLQPSNSSGATPAQPTVPPPPAPRPASQGDGVRAQNVTTRSGRSPIRQQARDPRGQPSYTPCELIILNGPYQGQAIDLGLAVNSTVHEQSANWNNQKSKGIREGVNFDGLSPREIRIELEYLSISEDIFHLLENIATLHEIGEGQRQPPNLMWVQGSARIAPVVCTGFTHTLENPHPGRKGYRKGKCEVRLLMPGGRGSEHALGKPLTAIPLGDIRADQTQLARQQQGRQRVAELLLAPCIGSEGSRELTRLLEQNRLSDPGAIAALPPETLTQAAIAGLIPVPTLQNPQVQQRVRAAIASSMAAAEPGLGPDARRVADGLLSGNFGGITNPQSLRQAIAMKPDFDSIAAAVISQSFGSVFQAGSSAGERLRNFGSCGMRLRNSGATDAKSSEDEATTLRRLNQAIASLSDDELKQRFGITTDDELKILKNGSPYQTREQFIEHLSRGGSMNAIALWSRFEETTPEEQSN